MKKGFVQAVVFALTLSACSESYETVYVPASAVPIETSKLIEFTGAELGYTDERAEMTVLAEDYASAASIMEAAYVASSYAPSMSNTQLTNAIASWCASSEDVERCIFFSTEASILADKGIDWDNQNEYDWQNLTGMFDTPIGVCASSDYELISWYANGGEAAYSLSHTGGAQIGDVCLRGPSIKDVPAFERHYFRARQAWFAGVNNATRKYAQCVDGRGYFFPWEQEIGTYASMWEGGNLLSTFKVVLEANEQSALDIYNANTQGNVGACEREYSAALDALAFLGED